MALNLAIQFNLLKSNGLNVIKYRQAGYYHFYKRAIWSATCLLPL